MGMLDEIAVRLANQSIASTTGANGWLIIKSLLPDSSTIPDKIVALVDTPGEPAEASTDINLSRPGLQVLVRGARIADESTSYEDARDEIEAIRNDLHGIDTNQPATSGRHYGGIWATQEPFLLEYDDSDRPVLACNFRMIRSTI